MSNKLRKIASSCKAIIEKRLYVFYCYIRLLYYNHKLKRNLKTKEKNKVPFREPVIHFICFSCRSHFEYLFILLKSLVDLRSKHIGNIYFYIDKTDYLAEEQIESLRKLTPELIIRKTGKFARFGEDFILIELQSFKEVEKEINPGDYVAKIDSDVKFLSDNVFKKVLDDQESHMIGCPYTTDKGRKYISGGCYFLHKEAIVKIISNDLYDVFKTTGAAYAHPWYHLPEDMTMLVAVKKYGGKIRLIDFHLPLDKLGNITKKDKEQYSVIHFYRCRDKMLESEI